MIITQLRQVALSLEAAAGITTSANATEAGYWKRIALAAEELAGASTAANENEPGYQLRTAVALEAIAGTSGGEENSGEGGYLKRIVDALEVQAGAVTTTSVASRIVTAAAAATFEEEPAGITFVNGQNITVTDAGSGWWRMTKTGGSDGVNDAWASSNATAGENSRLSIRGNEVPELYARCGLAAAPADDGSLSQAGESYVEIYGSGSGQIEVTVAPGAEMGAGNYVNGDKTGGAVQWQVEAVSNMGAVKAVPNPSYAVLSIDTLGGYLEVKFEVL